jgi:hypothetical protein
MQDVKELKPPLRKLKEKPKKLNKKLLLNKPSLSPKRKMISKLSKQSKFFLKSK